MKNQYHAKVYELSISYEFCTSSMILHTTHNNLHAILRV